MSPVGSLAGTYRVPLLSQQTPLPGAVIVGSPVFQWATEARLARKPVPVHFHVQVAYDVDFISMVEEHISWVNASLFDYENSPGVWVPLPSSGLAISDLGKNVRVRSSLTTLGDYFCQVRSEQLV